MRGSPATWMPRLGSNSRTACGESRFFAAIMSSVRAPCAGAHQVLKRETLLIGDLHRRGQHSDPTPPTRYLFNVNSPLDVLVLKVIALGPVHGYAIAQRLRQMSGDVLQVQQGSLYPALHRLEKRGWVSAEWAATETGREARFYSLTRVGRKQLAEQSASWDRLSAAVSDVLRTAE